MLFQKVKKCIGKLGFPNRYSFLLVLLPLLYAFPAFSQDKSSMDSLASQVQLQTKNRSKLSVYLQTSKGVYETGEDLWFKGYVLDAQTLFPSALDNILYVQLEREDSNQVVLQEKYPIENGFVDGHIAVPDSLKAGNYRLMTYSSRSFNQSAEAFYSLRKLKVVERISTQPKDTLALEQDKPIENDSIHFSVFPEGGHLVSGIQSTIAFKAVDAKGLPKDISGTLYENDKAVFDFESSHAGMGRFILTPNINSRYHIRLNDSLTQKNFKLPKIEPQGKVTQLLNNSKGVLTFQVSQSPNLKKETIYLRVQIRGVVYSIAKAVLDKAVIVKIPTTDLPQGIAEVTLFNENLKPVAERLVYVNQDQKLNIKIILDKSKYLTKEEVKIKLEVTNQNGKPVVAHLGMGVYDQIYKNTEDCKTIESHYQLSTQLKGSLYSPNYYFDKKNEDRKQALNLLLLTQGWRRYVWSAQNLKAQKPSDSLYVKDLVAGKLTYIKKRKDTPEQMMVAIYNPLEENKKLFIPLDSLGNFSLKAVHLKLGKKLFIKNFGRDNDRICITIEDPFSVINKVKENKHAVYPFFVITDKETYDETQNNLWASMQEGIVLEQVELKGKKNHVYREKYLAKLDSLAKLNMTIDYVCKNNVLNCLDHPENSDSRKPVEDEIYVKTVYWTGTKFEHIRSPGKDRQVFRTITLQPYKYPKLTDEYLMERFHLMWAAGFHEKREFYSPIYDKEMANDPFPDYRNTLFWKSDIITDEKGEATISFYCSDINTKFIGIIEGVSGDGLLGTGKFDFRVIK